MVRSGGCARSGGGVAGAICAMSIGPASGAVAVGAREWRSEEQESAGISRVASSSRRMVPVTAMQRPPYWESGILRAGKPDSQMDQIDQEIGERGPAYFVLRPRSGPTFRRCNMLEKRAFSFGENWQSYVENDYNEQSLASAQKHLLEFLGVSDLKSKSFLDIGSGSGIHSAAAFRAGAERVVSFDVDPASVAATRSLWRAQGCASNWHIQQGSILDPAFLATLEPADIVYSWGVLHHTGRMW